MEGVTRMLLSLRPRPLLIFLSMHEWCQRHKDRPRTLYVPGERLRGGFVFPDTPWARAEAEATAVCRKYGQACLSVFRYELGSRARSRTAAAAAPHRSRTAAALQPQPHCSCSRTAAAPQPHCSCSRTAP